MKNGILILILSLTSFSLSAQNVLSKNAINKMMEMDMVYAYPTEQSMFARMPIGKKFLKTDWAFRNDDWSLEVCYYLEPQFGNSRDFYPNIQMMNRVMTWATNEEEEEPEIAVRTLSREKSNELYGADFAAYIDFVPKTQITEKRFGKILFLHSETCGNAYVVFFMEEADIRVDHLFELLKFQGPETMD